MSGTLTFPIDDTLKAIVEHARNAPERKPNFAELYDPDCRKDGKEPADDVFPSEDDIDPSKIPFGLWLVKDQGVYLMSPGRPGLDREDGKGNLVSYALEAHPADEGCWDAARAIMGGDDCVEKLDLEFFEKAIAANHSAILVIVTPTDLSLRSRN